MAKKIMLTRKGSIVILNYEREDIVVFKAVSRNVILLL